MTKEEILAEIAAKIEGQGTAVDAGSALPGILRGILEIAVSGGNVQSDWAQTNSAKEDYIKNKPTIPAAQVQSDWSQADNTKVDFIKNKPSIPAAQVNADWNAESGVAQILNKPTIPKDSLIVDAEYNGDGNFKISDASVLYSAAQEGRMVILRYGTSDNYKYSPVIHIERGGGSVAVDVSGTTISLKFVVD